jgi:predicted GIY-YIG superfamily endonuclease
MSPPPPAAAAAAPAPAAALTPSVSLQVEWGFPAAPAAASAAAAASLSRASSLQPPPSPPRASADAAVASPPGSPAAAAAPVIYVLELQGGRFYVGKTGNLARRMKEHASGAGSAWSRLHGPVVRVVETREERSEHDENNLTKAYMMEHGMDKVRGGVYTTVELAEDVRRVLQTELWDLQGCCRRCGRQGHFVNVCYARTTVTGEQLVAPPAKAAGGAADAPPAPAPVPEGSLAELVAGLAGSARGDASALLSAAVAAAAAFSAIATALAPSISASASPQPARTSASPPAAPAAGAALSQQAAPAAAEDASPLSGTKRPAPPATQPVVGADGGGGGGGASPGKRASMLCTRCGRDSHTVSMCYARTHASGAFIHDEQPAKAAATPAAAAAAAAAAKAPDGSSDDSDGDVCFRCGRDSHYVAECYARTHVSGRPL